jgi:Bacterial Ig-like domain (group 3)
MTILASPSLPAKVHATVSSHARRRDGNAEAVRNWRRRAVGRLKWEAAMLDGQNSAASLEQASGARRTLPRTRAAEVLAASFGLLAAIIFAEPASTQIAKKGPAQVNLISAPNPSHVGQCVLFGVEVIGLDFGTTCTFVVTGTVTILSDGSPIDTISLVGGAGNFLTNALPGGTHTIVAQYSGDKNCFPASASVSQVVVAIAHDYNGDGKADLLWRDTSGNIAA